MSVKDITKGMKRMTFMTYDYEKPWTVISANHTPLKDLYAEYLKSSQSSVIKICNKSMEITNKRYEQTLHQRR